VPAIEEANGSHKVHKGMGRWGDGERRRLLRQERHERLLVECDGLVEALAEAGHGVGRDWGLEIVVCCALVRSWVSRWRGWRNVGQTDHR